MRCSENETYGMGQESHGNLLAVEILATLRKSQYLCTSRRHEAPICTEYTRRDIDFLRVGCVLPQESQTVKSDSLRLGC